METSFLNLKMTHPYRRFVSLRAFRYIISHSDRYEIKAHMAFFNVIERVPISSIYWDNMRHIKETMPEPSQGAINAYYLSLNNLLAITLSPDEMKRYLRELIEDEREEHRDDKKTDDELKAIEDRLDQMNEEHTKEFWIGLAMSGVSTAFGVVVWVMKQFSSGASSLVDGILSVGGQLLVNGVRFMINSALTVGSRVVASGYEAIVISVDVVSSVVTLLIANAGAMFEGVGWILYGYLMDRYINPALAELSSRAIGYATSFTRNALNTLYQNALNVERNIQIDPVEIPEQMIELAEIRSEIIDQDILDGYEPMEEYEVEDEDFWDRAENLIEEDGEITVVEEGGALIPMEIEAADVAVASESLSLGALVAGGAAGIGIAVISIIEIVNYYNNVAARRDVILKIKEAEQIYDAKFQELYTLLDSTTLQFTIPYVTIPKQSLFDFSSPESRRQYWSNMQFLGPTALIYMQWRIENKQVVSPSPGDIILELASLYRDLISPGYLWIADSYPQPWDPSFSKSVEEYNASIPIHMSTSKKYRLELANNNWRTRLSQYKKVSDFRAERNRDEFDRRVRELMLTHKVKPDTVKPGKIEFDLAWSDVLSSVIMSRHIAAGAEFAHCQTEDEALSILNVPVIRSFLDSIQTFVSNVIPTFTVMYPTDDQYTSIVSFPTPSEITPANTTVTSKNADFVNDNNIKCTQQTHVSIENTVRHGWKNSVDYYFTARDATSFTNVIGTKSMGKIKRVITYYTPVGFATFLEDTGDRLWFMLSLRSMAILIISPVVAATVATKQIRMLQPHAVGMTGTVQLHKAAGLTILSGLWNKLNPYVKPPSVDVLRSRDTTYAFSTDITVDPTDFFTVDLPQTMVTGDIKQYTDGILFTSGQNANSVLYCFVPSRKELIFMSTWAAGDILQYYLPTSNSDTTKEMPTELPEKYTDIFEALSYYIKTKDSSICNLYSETGQHTADYNVLKSLDRLPWYKLKVSREDAIACLNLHKELQKYDVIRTADMVEQVIADLSNDDFTKKYQLRDPEPVTHEMTLALPREYVQSGLAQKGGSGLRWSVYMYDSGGIAALIYDIAGELYNLMEIDGKMVLFAMSAAALTTMSVSIRSDLDANSGAIAVIGQASSYVWNTYSVSRSEIYKGVEVTSKYIWEKVGPGVFAFVFTEGPKHPKAVLASVGSAFLYWRSKEIRQYMAQVVGIGLVCIGGALITKELGNRSSKKRKSYL